MRLFPEWSQYTVNPEALRFHALEQLPVHQLMARTSLRYLRIDNNAVNGTDIWFAPSTYYFDTEAETTKPLAIIENAGLSSQIQYPVTLSGRWDKKIISEGHATPQDVQPSTLDIHLREYKVEGQQPQDLETLRMLEELVQDTLALSIPGHLDELSAHEESEIRVLEKRIAEHDPSLPAVNFANVYRIESGSLVNARAFSDLPPVEYAKLNVKANYEIGEDIGVKTTILAASEIYAIVQQLVGHPFYIKFANDRYRYPSVTKYLLFNADAPDDVMFRDIPPDEKLDQHFLINEEARASRRAKKNETVVQIVEEDIRLQLAELHMRKYITYRQKKIAKLDADKAQIEQLLSDSGIVKPYELYGTSPDNGEADEASIGEISDNKPEDYIKVNTYYYA